MKTILIAMTALAGIAGAAPLAIAPAAAQTVVHKTVVRSGPAAPVAHTRRVCRTYYRNHHRVRSCRVVRYR